MSLPQRSVAYRFPLLLLGFLSLLVGTGAGLLRLGWSFPLPAADLAAVHGPLMVCCFFGTVISLERAVALGRAWAYVAPASAGLAGAALIAGLPAGVAAGLMALAAGVLLAGSAGIHRRQREAYTLTLALGAACWLVGVLLWWGGLPVPRLYGWWLGFLVLTVAGERLELSRFLPPAPTAKRVFALLAGLLVVGMALQSAALDSAGRLLGATALALAGWLLRQDVARRTVRQQGLTRFIAVCLLSGYAWLAFGGAVLLVSPAIPFAYDAALHAIFVGFVLAMVFGHAPVIFPAVVRVPIPYHPFFYLPLALLHLSLLVRLGGDLLSAPPWRAAGGAGNALALAAFVAVTLAAVRRGQRSRAV